MQSSVDRLSVEAFAAQYLQDRPWRAMPIGDFLEVIAIARAHAAPAHPPQHGDAAATSPSLSRQSAYAD